MRVLLGRLTERLCCVGLVRHRESHLGHPILEGLGPLGGQRLVPGHVHGLVLRLGLLVILISSVGRVMTLERKLLDLVPSFFLENLPYLLGIRCIMRQVGSLYEGTIQVRERYQFVLIRQVERLYIFLYPRVSSRVEAPAFPVYVVRRLASQPLVLRRGIYPVEPSLIFPLRGG